MTVPKSSTVPMIPTPEAIRLYRDWVAAQRKLESDVEIPNEYPWNARIAIDELAKFASSLQQRSSLPQYVRIFTGTLSYSVYDDNWQKELLEFMNAGGHTRVLFWNSFNTVQGSLAKLSPAIRSHSKFAVRCSGSREIGERLNHFLVVGDQAFRNEAPHPYFEACTVSDTSPEVPSRICFFNKAEATRLVSFFDKVWEACTPISTGTTGPLALSDK